MSERQNELEGAARYGRFYWCVKSDLSPEGEIYLHADRVEFLPSGAVVFHCDQWGYPNMAFAAGQWTAVYAASVIDGHAVAVEIWKGEVVPGEQTR